MQIGLICFCKFTTRPEPNPLLPGPTWFEYLTQLWGGAGDMLGSQATPRQPSTSPSVSAARLAYSFPQQRPPSPCPAPTDPPSEGLGPPGTTFLSDAASWDKKSVPVRPLGGGVGMVSLESTSRYRGKKLMLSVIGKVTPVGQWVQFTEPAGGGFEHTSDLPHQRRREQGSWYTNSLLALAESCPQRQELQCSWPALCTRQEKPSGESGRHPQKDTVGFYLNKEQWGSVRGAVLFSLVFNKCLSNEQCMISQSVSQSFSHEPLLAFLMSLFSAV